MPVHCVTAPASWLSCAHIVTGLTQTASCVSLSALLGCALQDWAVVRDVVNHEWRVQGDDAASRDRTYLRPRFVKGCSFYFMQPAGVQHTTQQAS